MIVIPGAGRDDQAVGLIDLTRRLYAHAFTVAQGLPAQDRLLSVDFLKLVAASLLIAAPVGYYIMRLWLRNFAYRSPLRVELFFLNAGILLFIAFATIAFQSVKAALTDPARSLRQE